MGTGPWKAFIKWLDEWTERLDDVSRGKRAYRKLPGTSNLVPYIPRTQSVRRKTYTWHSTEFSRRINALSHMHGFHNRPVMRAWQFILYTLHSPLAGTNKREGPLLQTSASYGAVSAATAYYGNFITCGFSTPVRHRTAHELNKHVWTHDQLFLPLAM
jgi:hypothetical protein